MKAQLHGGVETCNCYYYNLHIYYCTLIASEFCTLHSRLSAKCKEGDEYSSVEC